MIMHISHVIISLNIINRYVIPETRADLEAWNWKTDAYGS